METKEPRKFPVEFDGPVLDTDTFEITLPAGYAVDDLPPPVDADCQVTIPSQRLTAMSSAIPAPLK